jgi:lysozyme family protein
MDTHERFINWFNWIIKWEGTSFENDPDDPGGATKFGIDQRSHPKEDIRNLTKDKAAEIYWNEYWTKSKAHMMPFGVGEVVGNIAVNAGLGRASKWLQADVGVVVDGQIGDKTLAAVKASNPDMLANTLLQQTENHYRSIAKGNLAKFLKGWLRRNNDLREFISKK